MRGPDWVCRLTTQLRAVGGGDDVRSLHRWLWETWHQDGQRIARDLNVTLKLQGDDELKEDSPHLFAGQPERARVLVVNINPGWNAENNAVVNSIVSESEAQSWEFNREVYSTRAGIRPSRWWNLVTGFALRVVEGPSGHRNPASWKREWANNALAGWELFPLHSRSTRNLTNFDGDGGAVVRECMQASLAFATRLPAETVIVASAPGSVLIDGAIHGQQWVELHNVGLGLPTKLRLFKQDQRLLIVIPRQLASRYSGLRFDELADAIRRHRMT